MDAIILVGGQGTRLRPLTAARHKSLVPVCNRPAIEYLFDWLARSGFERAILSLGVHNEDLAAAYPPGSHCGIRVDIVQETERLESGGAIRFAVQEAGIGERFTVVNGDVYVNFDFGQALSAHTASDAELTLALYDVEDPSPFGVAVTDGESLITQFVEKPPRETAPSKAINAGVWIFERSLVEEIPPGAVRVEETLFPTLVDSGRRVLGYRFEGPWEDIGTPTRYHALNMALLDGGADGISRDASIDVSARVVRSVIGPRARIGEGAGIQDSVLWEDVTIGAGATIEESVLADGVVVEDGASVVGAVIGSGARILAGTMVRPGASVAPKTSYDGADER